MHSTHTHARTLALRVTQSDRVRVRAGTGRDAHQAPHPVREHGGRGQRLHAAHAGTNGRVQTIDAELVQHDELRAHHVVDCDHRKPRGVRIARVWMCAAGPGGSVAATKHVGAHDVEVVRVDRAARTCSTAWISTSGAVSDLWVPMNSSHHPGALLAGWLFAWLLADSPVNSRMALSRAAFSFPHDSYASWNSGSLPP